MHWLFRYDPDDGEPYAEACECAIAADHNGKGDLVEIEGETVIVDEVDD